MTASASTQSITGEQHAPLHGRHKALLALLCVCAGILALSTRYVPDGVARITYGLLVTGIFLVLALTTRRRTQLHRYWDLSFAFFVLSAFVLLDNTVPRFVASSVLQSAPVTGNPLASTIGGSVIVQLVETLLAVVLVVGLTLAFGGTLGSVYLRVGKLGVALGIGIAGFLLFYLLMAVHPASAFFPTKGTITFTHYLALTPALLVVVLGNGFLEELVFRGLFLQKYNAVFGPVLANVVQAVIFALAHMGVSYTPFALIFIVVIVFPLGLICGTLMRRSDGIVASSLLHAGADIPIYLAFLSYV